MSKTATPPKRKSKRKTSGVQFPHLVQAKVADAEHAFIMRLAEEEERKPGEVVRRIIVAAREAAGE